MLYLYAYGTHEPARQPEPIVQTYLPACLERVQSAEQFLYQQMDQTAGTMGLSCFHFI